MRTATHLSRTLLCAALVAIAGETGAQTQITAASDAVVARIAVEGEIEDGLTFVIRRALHEAERIEADAIVLDMDTPGGKVTSVEEIMEMLLNTEIPVYTYVNTQAISGGALIAFATREIWMAPTGRIGDAAPIMVPMLPTGGPTEAPETVSEKQKSYVLALVRSAAQANGHRTEVGEAMVDLDKELAFGDRVISPEGKLLTLTSTEATEIMDDGRPLLAAGIADDLDEFLGKIGRAGADVVTIKETGAEQIARFLTSTAIASLLLMGGLLGIYVEIKTPGFGIPGILGIACFVLFFFGHNIAGLAGLEEVAVLIGGLVLIGIEIFILPGFGAAGIAGVLLVLTALVLAMIGWSPGGSGLPGWEEFEPALRVLAIAMLGSAVGAMLLARFLPGIPGMRRLILTSEARSADGYVASRTSERVTVGETGAAITNLRPAGKARFGERLLDVVTEGDWIGKRTPVRIAEIEGSRIVVVPSPGASDDESTAG